MQRLSDDLDWFCDKFDYRNKDADWRTSRMHCRVECRKRQEDIRQMSLILWTSKTKQAPVRCLRK